jgi:hypothetical protein
MSEEHKVYVPLRGKHVEPPPVYAYSARWYEEQGIPMPLERRLGRLRRWIGRTFEFDRRERHLRVGRLSIWWDFS